MADWLTGKVIEKIQWNERLFSLRIQCGFNTFESGQFVRIALDIEGERVARPYSLVNKPGDDYLEIYFNIVLDGPLSPMLARLDAGDAVEWKNFLDFVEFNYFESDAMYQQLADRLNVKNFTDLLIQECNSQHAHKCPGNPMTCAIGCGNHNLVLDLGPPVKVTADPVFGYEKNKVICDPCIQ